MGFLARRQSTDRSDPADPSGRKRGKVEAVQPGPAYCRSHMIHRVSVVIPVINESSHIQQAIRCAWEAGADEVVVVDGGSTDGTAELARQLECQLLQTAAGRGAQQNAGAYHSTGDVLLFLHADNWLAPRAIDQVRDALTQSEVEFGGFRQRIQAPGLSYRILEIGNRIRLRYFGLPYGDQGIFVRRKSFEIAGGFPETFLLEDLLLAKRLQPLSQPVLLPGPLHVSARRWQTQGVIRQTIRNWRILWSFRQGVPIDELAKRYRRHDQM